MPPLATNRRAGEGGLGPAPLPAKLPSAVDRCHPPHFAGVVFLSQPWFGRTSLSPHPESCPSAPRGEEEGGAPRASPGPRPAGPGRAAADGDDVRLGEAHPVPRATAGDGGRGGAAAVPGAVLLLREHRGLSWAGAARRPEEHPPQHREAVSIPAEAAASAPRPPATVKVFRRLAGRRGGPRSRPGLGSRRPLGGLSVLFPCCRRCPFHGDACRHRRGGRGSQPLLFIAGSRGEKRRSRRRGGTGAAGRAPPQPRARPERRRSGLFPRRRPFPGKLRYRRFLSHRRREGAGPRRRAAL